MHARMKATLKLCTDIMNLRRKFHVYDPIPLLRQRSPLFHFFASKAYLVTFYIFQSSSPLYEHLSAIIYVGVHLCAIQVQPYLKACFPGFN